MQNGSSNAWHDDTGGLCYKIANLIPEDPDSDVLDRPLPQGKKATKATRGFKHPTLRFLIVPNCCFDEKDDQGFILLVESFV